MMLLHEGLTHIQSQKKPWLQFLFKFGGSGVSGHQIEILGQYSTMRLNNQPSLSQL